MTFDPLALLDAVHGPWLWALVGVLAAAESAAMLGLLVPGETALVLAGVAVGLGHAAMGGVLCAAIVGAVIGDQLGFTLGRVGGRALRRGRLGRHLGAERWSRAEGLIERRGGVAVFLARWVGVLRAVVPAVAGAVGMPRRVFLVWNALGGSLWATSVVMLGVVAGHSWTGLAHWFGVVSAAVGLVGAAAVVLAIRSSRRRAEAQSEEDRVLEAQS